MVQMQSPQSRVGVHPNRQGRVRHTPAEVDVTGNAAGAAKRSGGSKLIYFFIFMLIVPVFFHIGSLRISPYLVFIILMFFPCFFVWITGKRGGLNIVDLFVCATTIWQCLALVVSGGVAASIEPMGIVVLQVLGAYLIGRSLVRNIHAFRKVIAGHCLAVAFMLPFALLEAVTARPFYLNLFRPLGSVFGNVIKDPRLGLDQVQAGFEHPILYGVFCASGFSLVAFGMKHKTKLVRLIAMGVISLSTFISLSTGALLVLTTQLGLITWGWLFRKNKKRWKVLGIIVTTLYVIVDLFSNRTPFHVFVDYMTFNAGNAYNRILIWKYGTAEVANNPVFGLGLFSETWERPYYMSSSMDNFWLVIAVRYGLPALIFLVGAFIFFLTRAGGREGLDADHQSVRLAIAFSLIGMFFGISSVHLWNASFVWLLFLLGSSVWLIEAGNGKKKAKPASFGAN